MIHRWMDNIMRRRAEQIGRSLLPFLEERETVLDVGCGTGHNADFLRRNGPWCITECDVTDMKRVGPKPVLFDGETLPFHPDCFDSILLIYVLHYSADPVRFLSELRRIAKRRLIVYQSIYHSHAAFRLLQCREALFGKGAYWFSKRLGYVPDFPNPMIPSGYMNLSRIREIFQQSGWTVQKEIPSFLPVIPLAKHLFILEKTL